MSIPVAIDDLAAATGEYGWAYLLTVRDDLRPHIVAVTPSWEGDRLTMRVGSGTARNAAQRPSVSLCYPPVEAGGYSLIVDGEAKTVDITPFDPYRFMRGELLKGEHAYDDHWH